MNLLATPRQGRNRQVVRIAVRLWALLPALLAFLMYFVTPTYFRPMFDNFVGWVLVCALAVITGGGYALIETGIWLVGKGRVARGVLVLVAYSLTGQVVALGIVLFGPAVLILMQPRT